MTCREGFAHRDYLGPQAAAQAKLNERANRFVDDRGLAEPMDVRDTGKIRTMDRGFVVEAANGGNLPGSTSPWDKLDVLPDGREVATSIKSMDPRSSSYTRGNAVCLQPASGLHRRCRGGRCLHSRTRPNRP